MHLLTSKCTCRCVHFNVKACVNMSACVSVAENCGGPRAGPPTVSSRIVGSQERVWILALFVSECWHHCADGTKSLFYCTQHFLYKTPTHICTCTHMHTKPHDTSNANWAKKKCFLFLTHMQTAMDVCLCRSSTFFRKEVGFKVETCWWRFILLFDVLIILHNCKLNHRCQTLFNAGLHHHHGNC